MRLTEIAAFLLCTAVASFGGGPAFVAGSGYDPGVAGRPMLWANASVQYYTDQGDLSPILPAAQADTFVDNSLSAWTSVSGVGLTVTQKGHLAEDVNGNNIGTDGSGTITSPADIAPSATSTPVGIVYDYDGSVTNALLGQGAGGSADCFTNAVYGGPDQFTSGGNIAHALIVVNGVCAASNAQLPDVQYRLVRLWGRVLGLGWSQADVNVLTHNPAPTSADFAGFPVMHSVDPISCVPISACYPNAAVPKLDDITTLARLYPAAGNSQPAGRLYGYVYFSNANGNAVQPMQGVNVVARLIDGTGQPSRQYVVSSVSGFAFHGNAGNIIDGYMDASGLRYDRWGSSDPAQEGFFDLGWLFIPSGQNIAQYQLSVEALDATWSLGVVPYAPTQVTPSGTFTPVVVTVTNGSNAERDILMLQSEIAQPHPGSGSTYANPAPLPVGGAWGSWISGYGSTDWFQFTARANRTASVWVTALDEGGRPAETKLAPVIGMWQLSDQSGNPAPASTPSPFNTMTWGMSRLDAQFGATDTYRLGIADYRGDGRPDYFYHASMLYSDTLTPARLPLSGGLTTLSGVGFRSGLLAQVGANTATVLSASAVQIDLAVPGAAVDGVATIQVTDPGSGGFSRMIGALTYGALASDRLLLLQGSEPATPVGAQAPSPIRVRAVASDGVTPVSGATIAWSGANGLQFSACNGASSCSVLSDAAGESYSWVTPQATGQSTVTIALAPASYSPPQTQQATIVATSSSLDLVAIAPTRWIGQGATIAVPLTAEVLDLGVPQPGVTVNFTLTKGTASLSAGSAATNGSGFATITAQITNHSADVQVSACVAPNNSPCQTFTLFSVPSSLWTLETVSGSSQAVQTGQLFQPLVMRVVDGSPAANPVMGVNVVFETTLARVNPDKGGNGLPVILGSSQAVAISAQDGTASIVPSASNVGPCDVFVSVTAGRSNVQFQMENLAAIVPVPTKNGDKDPPPRGTQFRRRSPDENAGMEAVFAAPDGGWMTAPTSAPPPDPNPATCSDLSASEQFAASTCPNSDASGDKASKKPPRTDRGIAGGNGPPTTREVSRASELERAAQAQIKEDSTKQASTAKTSTPRDRRSCWELAGDGPVF